MNEWQQKRYEDARAGYEALMKFYPFTLDNFAGKFSYSRATISKILKEAKSSANIAKNQPADADKAAQ